MSLLRDSLELVAEVAEAGLGQDSAVGTEVEAGRRDPALHLLELVAEVAEAGMREDVAVGVEVETGRDLGDLVAAGLAAGGAVHTAAGIGGGGLEGVEGGHVGCEEIGGGEDAYVGDDGEAAGSHAVT